MLTPELIAQLAQNPQALALVLSTMSQATTPVAPVTPAPVAPTPVEEPDVWGVVKEAEAVLKKARSSAQATLRDASSDELAVILQGIADGQATELSAKIGKQGGFTLTDEQKEEKAKANESRVEYLNTDEGKKALTTSLENAESIESFVVGMPRRSDLKQVKTARWT